MNRDAIRAFLQRPWAEVEQAKREHWATQCRRGAETALELGAALYAHARSVRPDWPSAEERADDLAAHAELKRLLQRVDHGLTRH